MISSECKEAKKEDNIEQWYRNTTFYINELTLNESIKPAHTRGGCSLNDIQMVLAALTIASFE